MNTIRYRRWFALAPLLFAAFAWGQDDPGVAEYKAGNYTQAYNIWMAEAAKGDPKSQFRLGVLYESGKGVITDYDTAAYWYKRASDSGCRAADCNLGNLYKNGNSSDASTANAIRHFARCVSAGGTCREKMSEMRVVAVDSLTGYADQGNAEAQYQLAMSAEDFGIYDRWLQKAARQGHGLAQVDLGFCRLSVLCEATEAEDGSELIFQAMIQNRDRADIHRQAQLSLALAYYNDYITTTVHQPTAENVWARLALADSQNSYPSMTEGLEMIAREAEETMTDYERKWADLLVVLWSELFAKGLPGVTEQHLRTLETPH